MVNVFKMEIFRLKKQKSWWIITLINALLIILSLAGTLLLLNSINSAFTGGPTQISFNEIYFSVGPGVVISLVVLTTLLFTVLFLNNLRAGGYHKNVIGVIGSYQKIVFVDFIISTIFMLIQFLGGIIISLVVVAILGEYNSFGNMGPLLVYLPTAILILIGLNAVVTLLYALLREKRFIAVVVLVVLGSTILSIVLSGFDLLIDLIVKQGDLTREAIYFKPSYLLNQSNLSSLPTYIVNLFFSDQELVPQYAMRFYGSLVIAVVHIGLGLFLTIKKYNSVDQA